MQKFCIALLTFISLTFITVSSATEHGTYPASDWLITNHCKIPVIFTINNEDGQIELQKVLQPGESYNQPMGRPRTMSQAEQNPKFTAFTLSANNEKHDIDYYLGGYWNGMSGGISIHVPYFYYNKDLDHSGCM